MDPTNLHEVQNMCVSSMFLIRLVMQWIKDQSRFFKDDFPCAFSFLEQEPTESQGAEDVMFPSFEPFNSNAVSPIQKPELIFRWINL